MNLSGRPLLATRLDVPLYVDCGIEPVVMNAARRGLNTLVVGEAGSGKTSLLHRIEYEFRNEEFKLAFVDGRSCESVQDLLEKIGIQLGVEFPRQETVHSLFGLEEPFIQKPPQSEPPSVERILAKLVKAIPQGPRSILFFDSPERDLAHAFFGRLRDAVWQLPITWIVAADSNAADAFRRPPADAFFEIVERIPALDDSRAREILRSRLADESSAGEMGKAATPRILLDHARRVMLDFGTAAILQRMEVEFQRRLDDVSRAAAMLANELRGQGPVSASDADVQRRLGWTRPRLTQVLKELESAGLARATEASDGHPGRPRRLYEIVTD